MLINFTFTHKNITVTSLILQKHPKQSKWEKPVHVAWRIFLCRQAVHEENLEIRSVTCVAWRVARDREAVSGKILET